MRETAVTLGLLAALPVAGWGLVQGFRTGVMDAVGVPVACYDRSTNPFMFWLATAYNATILIGVTAVLIAEIV